MLNNININELENYLNTIFDLESEKKDKNIVALEFEILLDALAAQLTETGTLQNAR